MSHLQYINNFSGNGSTVVCLQHTGVRIGSVQVAGSVKAPKLPIFEEKVISILQPQVSTRSLFLKASWSINSLNSV